MTVKIQVEVFGLWCCMVLW